MRKLILCTAGLIGLAVGGAAQAAVTFTAFNGTNPYSGPAPTYDFETAATTPVFIGGQVQSGNTGTGAAPFPGNTGSYYTVGPAPNAGGTPGTINLTSFGDIFSISFLWGSVDQYNDLDFLDGMGNVLATFNGNAIAPPANGNQGSPATNPLVVFNLTGTDVQNFSFLRLRSTQQAFEIDNLAINAVPEPTTWALLILGFGAIGSAMRRRGSEVRTAKAKLHFA